MDIATQLISYGKFVNLSIFDLCNVMQIYFPTVNLHIAEKLLKLTDFGTNLVTPKLV